MIPLPGLLPVHWLLFLIAVSALLLMAETAIGHYRSRFPLRVQFVPLVSEALLTIGALAAGMAPRASWARPALTVSSGFAVLAGLVGVFYHHWFGIVRKAGGYRWLLHHVMYGAPPLAPLALSMLGLFALASTRSLDASELVADVRLARTLLGLVSIALAGAIVQIGVLHYRGAFNTPLMYAPFVAPPFAVFAAATAAVRPELIPAVVTSALLLLTALTGIVGFGMHLRGSDRQMGGLHVFSFNVLQGPPPFAPAMMATFAMIGLIAIGLLR